MSSSTVKSFDPSIFNSYNTLHDFFLKSNAVNDVLIKKDKPYTKVLVPLNPKLSFPWKVCQFATAPFRWISALVLRIIGKIGSACGANGFGKQMKTLSQRAYAGFNVYSKESTHLFKIKNSINAPNSEGKQVFNTPTIPENKITDPEVRKRTFIDVQKRIEFSQTGHCRGMSNWFIYLWLKTKGQFSDPRRHMAAIGRQFKHGAGMEATLLQSIYLRNGKILDMRTGIPTPNGPINEPLLKRSSLEWKQSKQQMIDQLQNLPAGAYDIGLTNHATAYIKINPQLGYFFDPNDGLIEINGDHLGEKLYEKVLETFSDNGNKFSETNFIRFTPCQLR